MTKRKPVRSQDALWANNRVREVARLLPVGMDPGPFVAWLGAQLEKHRGYMYFEGTQLSAGSTRKELEGFRKRIQALLDALGDLPTQVGGFVARVAYRKEVFKTPSDWYRLRTRLKADLEEVDFLFLLAGQSLAGITGKRGRKSNQPRDRLLAEVARVVEKDGKLRREAARETASEILLFCGISTPTDPRTRRRHIRRGG